MIHLEGLKTLQKVPWNSMRPGLIVLGGVSVNGGLPPELIDYPVLTQALIHELHRKYIFFQNKSVLVAEASSAASLELGDQLREAKERVEFVNQCRRTFAGEKKSLIEAFDIALEPGELICRSKAVIADHLRLDRYNSFDFVIPPPEEEGTIPSMFHSLEMEIMFSDVLSGQLLSKFHLPEETPCVLHIGLDYSFSMSGSKISTLVSAVNRMCRTIEKLFPKTEIHVYAFSDECAEIRYPVSGREIEKRDTSYDAFFKKVLSNRKADIRNKALLISDGVPTDFAEACRRAETLRRLKIDYTQLIYSFSEEDRTLAENAEGKAIDGYYAGDEPVKMIVMDDAQFMRYKEERYLQYTRIADIAHGNQIIADIHTALGLLSIESYDRYIGMMSRGN